MAGIKEPFARTLTDKSLQSLSSNAMEKDDSVYQVSFIASFFLFNRCNRARYIYIYIEIILFSYSLARKTLPISSDVTHSLSSMKQSESKLRRSHYFLYLILMSMCHFSSAGTTM